MAQKFFSLQRYNESVAHCPLFPIYLVILSDFSLKVSLHALRMVGMTGKESAPDYGQGVWTG